MFSPWNKSILIFVPAVNCHRTFLWVSCSFSPPRPPEKKKTEFVPLGLKDAISADYT